MIPDKVIAKFHEGRVVNSPDECWPFEGGSYNKKGWHRAISGRGSDGVKRNYMAHRVAYELAYGEIVGGACVLHRCDNPVCCNPSHLFLGTRADNVQDMHSKGRAKHGGEKRRGVVMGPSTHRKLTREQLVEAVQRYLAGETQRTIAASFGISDVALGNAFKGKLYTDMVDVVAPVKHLLGRGTSTAVKAAPRADVARDLYKRGLNQYEIAAQLGVCQATVSLYTRKKHG